MLAQGLYLAVAAASLVVCIAASYRPAQPPEERAAVFFVATVMSAIWPLLWLFVIGSTIGLARRGR